MFSWMKKIYKNLMSQKSKHDSEDTISVEKCNDLSGNIEVNLKKMKETFANASDVVIRQFEIGADICLKAFIIYIDGLIDKEVVQISLMKPLMVDIHLSETNRNFNRKTAFTIIKERILSVSEVKEIYCFQDAIDAVLSGDTALFLDGSSTALNASLRGWEAGVLLHLILKLL